MLGKRDLLLRFLSLGICVSRDETATLRQCETRHLPDHFSLSRPSMLVVRDVISTSKSRICRRRKARISLRHAQSGREAQTHLLCVLDSSRLGLLRVVVRGCRSRLELIRCGLSERSLLLRFRNLGVRVDHSLVFENKGGVSACICGGRRRKRTLSRRWIARSDEMFSLTHPAGMSLSCSTTVRAVQPLMRTERVSDDDVSEAASSGFLARKKTANRTDQRKDR